MDSKQMKDIVAKKISERQGQMNVIKADVEKLIDDILSDCKEVIVEIPTLKDFGSIALDVADEATDTGIFDMVDGVIAKMAFNKFVDTPANEEKYRVLREKALEAIENAGK